MQHDNMESISKTEVQW